MANNNKNRSQSNPNDAKFKHAQVEFAKENDAVQALKRQIEKDHDANEC